MGSAEVSGRTGDGAEEWCDFLPFKILSVGDQTGAGALRCFAVSGHAFRRARAYSATVAAAPATGRRSAHGGESRLYRPETLTATAQAQPNLPHAADNRANASFTAVTFAACPKQLEPLATAFNTPRACSSAVVARYTLSRGTASG